MVLERSLCQMREDALYAHSKWGSGRDAKIELNEQHGAVPHETRTLRTLLGKGFKPSVVYALGASKCVPGPIIARTLFLTRTTYLFEPLAESVPFYRRTLRYGCAAPKFSTSPGRRSPSQRALNFCNP